MNRTLHLSFGLALLLLQFVTAPLARAQTTITANWISGTGSWSVATNWDIGRVPNNGNGTNYTVVIPGSGLLISYLVTDRLWKIAEPKNRAEER